ncbi:MAG: TonB family protein / TonB-dependent receptor, partial [Myxococcaceae bacterium]|nr:TonB family protein / TonB-dependent receptor [Myxococcaceae bacterium]
RSSDLARYTGIFSYTLLNSERKDHADLPWRKFDYQQTHGLTLALLYVLPRGWEAGVAARYYTGNPYTPIVGRVFNATDRSYQQLLGSVNSARSPSYNRIDLRVQKTWQARRHTTTLYLDIQNVLNHHNQEAVFYNYDSTRRGVVHGLPIIPALGVRGQF